MHAKATRNPKVLTCALGNGIAARHWRKYRTMKYSPSTMSFRPIFFLNTKCTSRAAKFTFYWKTWFSRQGYSLKHDWVQIRITRASEACCTTGDSDFSLFQFWCKSFRNSIDTKLKYKSKSQAQSFWKQNTHNEISSKSRIPMNEVFEDHKFMGDNLVQRLQTKRKWEGKWWKVSDKQVQGRDIKRQES